VDSGTQYFQHFARLGAARTAPAIVSTVGVVVVTRHQGGGHTGLGTAILFWHDTVATTGIGSAVAPGWCVPAGSLAANLAGTTIRVCGTGSYLVRSCDIGQAEAGQCHAGEARAEFFQCGAARDRLRHRFGEVIEFAAHVIPFGFVLLFVSFCLQNERVA
jgi:hypothetical protein